MAFDVQVAVKDVKCAILSHFEKLIMLSLLISSMVDVPVTLLVEVFHFIQCYVIVRSVDLCVGSKNSCRIFVILFSS